MGNGRHALIVAVADYLDPKLKQLRAPAADAERLAAVLGDPKIGGFQVHVSSNERGDPLRRRIATFFGNRRPDDLLLVHFSCHGIKDDRGELYLAATDTETGDLLAASGIAAAWLNDQIGRSRSKRVVVLLDCCFSGSFPFGMRSRAGEDVHVESHLGGRGRAVITASNSMEYAYEGEHLTGAGAPSIFTHAVAEALETGKADRDLDHWISVDELYDYVFDRVKEKTPSQTPQIKTDLEGRVYIARSSYLPPMEPAELDQSITEAMEHPLASVRAGAVEELEGLLRSRNPRVALAARKALEALADDDSRKVSVRAEEVLKGAAHAGNVPVAAQQAQTPAASERDGPQSPGVPRPTASPIEGPKHRWPASRIALLSGALFVAAITLFGIFGDNGSSPSGAGQGVAGAVLMASFAGLVWAIVRALTKRGQPH